MKRLIATACAALMTTSIPFVAPAVAMPVAAPALSHQNDVVQVQYRDRNFRRGFERRGNDSFYNGHRGYHDYRPGYRRYNGFWFPPAAFIAGAIIGGAIAGQQPPPARVVRPSGNAHVEWCYNRYRSYRASDNTFQPYNGPRKQCYSPYS